MSGRILTFTNLFPSALRPQHGCFVKDRMARVALSSGLEWQVLSPVARVPWLLRRPVDRLLAAEPEREVLDGTTVHHVHYFHLPGISVGPQARRMARACLPLVRELTREAPTVLDAHYVYPDGVAAMMIAKQLGLPCVVTARGTDVIVLAARRRRARRQVQELMPGADRLFAVSDDLRDRLAAVLGGAPVQTARNGVDLDLFRPGDRRAARAALGLPQDVPLVLGVGRLVEVKGFHLAAEAVARHLPGAHLVLVGAGPYAARIRRLLPPERLHLLGPRDRQGVALAFQACDVFTLPSSREGWPNVVTEALACGLPVVASTAGGIPKILTDPELSTMLPVVDVATLGRSLAASLADPPDPARVRALAERYSWDDTVALLSDTFQQLLS